MIDEQQQISPYPQQQDLLQGSELTAQQSGLHCGL